jgi:hypothetical protein
MFSLINNCRKLTLYLRESWNAQEEATQCTCKSKYRSTIQSAVCIRVTHINGFHQPLMVENIGRAEHGGQTLSKKTLEKNHICTENAQVFLSCYCSLSNKI